MPNSAAEPLPQCANELTQWGTATLTYDANGNMLSSGADGYTWEARNHLVSTLSGAAFHYDPFGRRTTKTISGVTTNFLYDGLNPVQELSGTTVTANLMDGLGVDEHFLRTDSAGARNFLTDALGSTVALADSVGTAQTSYTYEPFGKTSVTGQASMNPYQFTGRENDGTGLYFYRARYYNPIFGRFISEDPIGFAGGVNLYAYAGAAPTNFVGPLGLDKKDPLRTLQDLGKQAVCGATSLLRNFAEANNAAVGVGIGGSAVAGIVYGVSATGGVQVVADPEGNVGVAITMGGNPGIGVVGAGANAGALLAQARGPVGKTSLQGLRF